MILRLRHFLGWIASAFCSHPDLLLENLALPPTAANAARQETSPTTQCWAKAVCVMLRSLWSAWKQLLVLITPRTVVGCASSPLSTVFEVLSRKGRSGGRKPVSREIRALILRMSAENPTRGAPTLPEKCPACGENWDKRRGQIMAALIAVRSLEDSLPSNGGVLFSFEIAEGAYSRGFRNG
jgi:hypothetical protein